MTSDSYSEQIAEAYRSGIDWVRLAHLLMVLSWIPIEIWRFL